MPLLLWAVVASPSGATSSVAWCGGPLFSAGNSNLDASGKTKKAIKIGHKRILKNEKDDSTFEMGEGRTGIGQAISLWNVPARQWARAHSTQSTEHTKHDPHNAHHQAHRPYRTQGAERAHQTQRTIVESGHQIGQTGPWAKRTTQTHCRALGRETGSQHQRLSLTDRVSKVSVYFSENLLLKLNN